MKLPWIKSPEPPSISMPPPLPLPVLPEMTLRWATVVPPIRLFDEFSSLTPLPPLPAAVVPFAAMPT